MFKMETTLGLAEVNTQWYKSKNGFVKDVNSVDEQQSCCFFCLVCLTCCRSDLSLKYQNSSDACCDINLVLKTMERIMDELLVETGARTPTLPLDTDEQFQSTHDI